MKVYQMKSTRTGKSVANQFIISGDDGTETFQSYRSVIAIRKVINGERVTILDSDKWNYSKTTSKYRNEFLNETTRETKERIASGFYLLADLN